MGKRTSYAHGTFSWVDNPTTDQEGAKRFYAELFGWEYDDVPVGDGLHYMLAKLRGDVAAAIAPQMQNERDMGVPPHWNSYIAVDDVDAIAAEVEALGGRLHMPPFDVADAGRMAPFSDPVGAVAYLWQAGRRRGADVVNEPGAFTWNEAATPDPDASMAFYSALLGWSFEEIEGIPGMRYWTIENSGRDNGGLRLDDQLQPHWLVYFAVDSIDASIQTATAAGAEVVVPKTPAGPPNHFAVVRDPAGAVFALFEGRLDD